MIEDPRLYLAAIVSLGIFAQWVAWRVCVPAIVFLILGGFLFRYLAGPPSEVIPGDVLFPVVSLSVGLILFEGGLTFRFRGIRETGGVLLRLVTIGLLVTWALVALAAHFVLGLGVEMATLVGAIDSGDPTIVRGRGDDVQRTIVARAGALGCDPSAWDRRGGGRFAVGA